jgi:hypothetical protein
MPGSQILARENRACYKSLATMARTSIPNDFAHGGKSPAAPVSFPFPWAKFEKRPKGVGEIAAKAVVQLLFATGKGRR